MRGEILENLALGKKFIRAGYKVRCYGGKETLSFRMYPQGLRSLFSGFSRSLATGSQTMSFLTLLLIVCWVVGAFGVTRNLLQSAFLGDVTGLLCGEGSTCSISCRFTGCSLASAILAFRRPFFFRLPLIFFAAAFCLVTLSHVLQEKGNLEGKACPDWRGEDSFVRLIHLPTFWTVLVDFMAWFIIHIGVAFVPVRVPARRFDPDGWLFKSRDWEQRWADLFALF